MFSIVEKCHMKCIKWIRGRHSCLLLVWIDLQTVDWRLYAILYFLVSYCTGAENCADRMFHSSATICPDFCTHQMTYHMRLNWPNNYIFWICFQNLCLQDLFSMHHKNAKFIPFFRVNIMSHKFFKASIVWLRLFEVVLNRHEVSIRWKQSFDMPYVAVQNRNKYITYFLAHKLTETVNSLGNYSEITFCTFFILGMRRISIST